MLSLTRLGLLALADLSRENGRGGDCLARGRDYRPPATRNTAPVM